LLPGTAFVELALRAGGEVGCDVLEELTLEAPLILPEDGAAQLQLTLSEADEAGRRELAVYSRAEEPEADGERDWTRHASGALVAADVAAEPEAEAWPP